MSIIELIIWMQSGLLVLALMPVALIYVLLRDYFNEKETRRFMREMLGDAYVDPKKRRR